MNLWSAATVISHVSRIILVLTAMTAHTLGSQLDHHIPSLSSDTMFQERDSQPISHLQQVPQHYPETRQDSQQYSDSEHGSQQYSDARHDAQQYPSIQQQAPLQYQSLQQNPQPFASFPQGYPQQHSYSDERYQNPSQFVADSRYASNYPYSGQIYGHSNKVTGKSFIILDPTNLINFVIQITVPFAIDYSFLGFGRKKRDIGEMEHSFESMVGDLLEVKLAKLQAIFLGLGVQENECFEEVICAVHQQPESFQPLPSIIGQLLNNDNLKPDFEHQFNCMNTSSAYDYSRYVRAIRQGSEDSEKCASSASKCAAEINGILNRPTFKFLQYVNSFASVQMT